MNEKKVNKTTRQLRESEQFKSAFNNKIYLNKVPLYFCTKFDLSPAELLILCRIQQATQDAPLKAYTGSINGLCSICNISKPTARKAVERLNEEGFIRKGFFMRNNKRIVAYKALILQNPNNRNMTMEDWLHHHKEMNKRENNKRFDIPKEAEERGIRA